MFKELKPVLEKANLHIEVSSSGTQISLTIHPRKKNKDEDMSTLPLAVSGTAEEIDKELPGILLKSLAKVVGFTENSEAFEEDLKKTEAEKKKKSEDAKKPGSSSSKTTTPAASGDPAYDAKKASAKEKAGYAAIIKLIKDGPGHKDPDMISYMKKMAIAKADDMGIYKPSMLKLIKDAFDGGTKDKTDVSSEGMFKDDTGNETVGDAEVIDTEDSDEEVSDDTDADDDTDDAAEEETPPPVTKAPVKIAAKKTANKAPAKKTASVAATPKPTAAPGKTIDIF